MPKPTSITIEDAIEKLDPSPWLVSLSDEQRAIYAAMRETEDEWIKALVDAGSQIAHPHTERDSRRALLVVPGDVKLPSTKALQRAVAAWRETVQAAAEEQNKEDTVGVRAATMPVWIDAAGADRPLQKGRPDYVAKRVATHLQRAYRGAAVEPEASLEVLRRRLDRSHAALAHSRATSKNDRIRGQEEAIERYEVAVAQLTAYISQGRVVSVRFASGTSWRVNVRTEDKSSIAFTVATVALVPGTAETLIEPAHKRSRKKPEEAGTELVMLPGGIEVRIK